MLSPKISSPLSFWKKEIAKIDIFVNLITKPLTHAIPTITDLAKHLLRKGAKQNFLMTWGGGKCKRIFPKNPVSKQKKLSENFLSWFQLFGIIFCALLWLLLLHPPGPIWPHHQCGVSGSAHDRQAAVQTCGMERNQKDNFFCNKDECWWFLHRKACKSFLHK